MGLLGKYKEMQEKKLKDHEDRLKEIDEFNFQAMCRAGGFTEEEGRKAVEENISKGIYKFHLDKEENIVKQPIKEEKKVCCPKCGSTQLTANKKGFGLAKGAVGVLVTGSAYGIVASGIGKNKIIITCLNCGKQFKPGDK